MLNYDCNENNLDFDFLKMYFKVGVTKNYNYKKPGIVNSVTEFS